MKAAKIIVLACREKGEVEASSFALLQVSWRIKNDILRSTHSRDRSAKIADRNVVPPFLVKPVHYSISREGVVPFWEVLRIKSKVLPDDVTIPAGFAGRPRVAATFVVGWSRISRGSRGQQGNQ